MMNGMTERLHTINKTMYLRPDLKRETVIEYERNESNNKKKD